MTLDEKLEVTLLYLDRSICGRCKATDEILDEALAEMREDLRQLKEVSVKKIRIENDAEAKKHGLVRSPTLLMNGIDIEKILMGQETVTDNYCPDCEKVCGDSCTDSSGGGTQCRTFSYKGEMYDSPPKAMIKDAIRHVLVLMRR